MPKSDSKALIPCVLNRIGFPSVLFGNLSFRFACWVNPMCTPRVKDCYVEAVSHFLGIFVIQCFCSSAMNPKPVRIGRTVDQDLSNM